MDPAQDGRGAHRAWWGEIVWRARAGILVFALCAMALILPAQVQDMLANLADFGDFSVEGVLHALGFHGAMILVAFELWFWGRAVLLAWYRLPDRMDAHDRLRGGLDLADADRDRMVAAFDFVPRGMALGIAAVAAIACARSGKWLETGIAIGWGIGFYWLLQHRLAIQARLGLAQAGEKTPRGEAKTWLGAFWRRMLELFDYAPISRGVAVLGMALATGLFAMSAVTAFVPHSIEVKTYLAHLLPGPSVALFLFGMTVAPLSAITYGVDRASRVFKIFGRRLPLRFVPVIGILLLLTGMGASLVNLHALRVIDDPGAMKPAQRASLATLFKAWAAKCAPGTGPVQPIVVAVSGGASRAGLWAARVLDVVDDSVRKSGTKNAAIFAISSVSGGSLGTAAYESMRAGVSAQRPPGAVGNCTLPLLAHDQDDARAQAEIEALRADAIGPALAGMILGDAPRGLAVYLVWPAVLAYQAIVPPDPKADRIALLRGNDRAEALEGAFENNWRSNAIAAFVDDKIQTEPFDLGEAYLSLFYRDPKTPRGDVPLWITNGTDVQSGDRIVTVPFDVNGEKFCTAKRSNDVGLAGTWFAADVSNSDKAKAWAACGPNAAYFWYEMGPFLSSYDALGLLKTDIPISTAVDNTSRFPFLSPSGELTPTQYPNDNAKKEHDAQIIDGGYFENEGVVSAMEMARWLRLFGPALIGRPVYPIIVQATADADPGKKERDIPRCGNARPVNPDVADVESRASQFLVPLIGLTSVRGGHSRAFLAQALQDFCDEGGQQAFFHFYLYDSPDFEVPLNWSLSEEVADFIWTDAMAMCGNEADRRNLVATLRLDPNAWKPRGPRRAARDLYTCTDAPVKVKIPDLPALKEGEGEL